MARLLLATNNRAKVEEFRRLLAGSGLEPVTPRELGIALDVEESGSTYEENARLKARAAVQSSGLVALGDDSGLEVDALAGAPGIYSARYTGPSATDGDNRRKLLAALAGKSERGARFRCLLVIADASGADHSFEGTCEGAVALEERGANGFGYDSIFLPAGCAGRTMAELTNGEKDELSHRGRALRAALPALNRLKTI